MGRARAAQARAGVGASYAARSLLLLYSRGGLLLLRNGLSFGHLGELEPEDSDGGSLDRLSCGVAIESYRRSRHVVMWFVSYTC
jgi:hypothetical protein